MESTSRNVSWIGRRVQRLIEIWEVDVSMVPFSLVLDWLDFEAGDSEAAGAEIVGGGVVYIGIGISLSEISSIVTSG
jgi:hypothetical protein